MDELYIDGRKIKAVDEEEAEFTYLKGKYSPLTIGYNGKNFKVYMRDIDILKIKEMSYKVF